MGHIHHLAVSGRGHLPVHEFPHLQAADRYIQEGFLGLVGDIDLIADFVILVVFRLRHRRVEEDGHVILVLNIAFDLHGSAADTETVPLGIFRLDVEIRGNETARDVFPVHIADVCFGDLRVRIQRTAVPIFRVAGRLAQIPADIVERMIRFIPDRDGEGNLFPVQEGGPAVRRTARNLNGPDQPLCFLRFQQADEHVEEILPGFLEHSALHEALFPVGAGEFHDRLVDDAALALFEVGQGMGEIEGLGLPGVQMVDHGHRPSGEQGDLHIVQRFISGFHNDLEADGLFGAVPDAVFRKSRPV